MRPRTKAAAGICLASVLAAGGALAGDEDISPSAYQEFDPVTGYMITVDPEAGNGQGKGHDNTDGQADPGQGPAEGAPSPAGNAARSFAWLYWAIVAVAGAAVLYWLRGKVPGKSAG